MAVWPAILLLETYLILSGLYVINRGKPLNMTVLSAIRVLQGVLAAAFALCLAFRLGWITVLINTVLIMMVLYDFEHLLYKKDTFLRLPMDLFYYSRHAFNAGNGAIGKVYGFSRPLSGYRGILLP